MTMRPNLSASLLAVWLGLATSCGAPEIRYAEQTGGGGTSSGGQATGGESSAGLGGVTTGGTGGSELGGVPSAGAGGMSGAGAAPPTHCANGALDGDETDADCGGSCEPCDDRRACQVDADCRSAYCLERICATPGCDNGLADPDEGGADCGGVCSALCPVGERCAVDWDCASGVCIDRLCVAETCTDQVKNGSESDEDCGGSNPACARCEVGNDCRLDSDCATESCVELTCTLVCPDNFADCDGAVDNGCEANLLTGVDACGDCATRCTLPHAVAACSAGACVIATDTEGQARCIAPYGACDSDTANGCEVNLDTDPENCGGCGLRCTDANGTPVCVDGTCDSACASGYEDCTGDYRCETDTTASVEHCGACGATCPAVGGTPWCQDSECGVTNCPAGTGDCDGNTTCETDLDTADDNCGACGNACRPQDGTGDCVAGACAIVGCNDGFGDCDDGYENGCEQGLTTLDHCGACATPCARDGATTTCEAGTCEFVACNTSFGDCDADLGNGCETDLRSTVAHCGACESGCAIDHAVAACADSACAFAACDPDYADCNGYLVDGCEAALLTDELHCGTCDGSCPVLNMTTCTSGVCGTCASEFGDCTAAAGCETPITADPNCGACGVNCSGATPRCSAQTCKASLIANGAFETNTTGWYTWGNPMPTIATSTTTAHSGQRSLAVSGSGLGPAATEVQSVVQAGQTYQFSAWVNLGGAASGTAHVTSAVTCGTAAAVYDWLTTPATVTAGTWIELTGTLTVPTTADCATLSRLTLYVEGGDLVNPTSTVNLYVDDVTLGL